VVLALGAFLRAAGLRHDCILAVSGPERFIALRAMRFAPTSAALLAAAFAAVFALAGCSAEFSVGGDSEASGEELAEDIKSDYAERTEIELPRLTCEGVESAVGARFTCSGRNARSVQLEISGKVTDAEGDGFDYNWRVTEAVAPGVLYERALRRSLEEEGVGIAEVRCPVEVDVKSGTTLSCKATDANGESRGVTLKLTDLDGGFDYSVEGAPPSQAGAAS